MHDPKQGAGHKSHGKSFTGHKAAVAADVDTQLLTAVEVLAGNEPEGETAAELVEASEDNTGSNTGRRTVVEHRMGRLVQLGIRQSRYFGRKKTLFQVLMAATVANRTLVMNWQGVGASCAALGRPSAPCEVSLSVCGLSQPPDAQPHLASPPNAETPQTHYRAHTTIPPSEK